MEKRERRSSFKVKMRILLLVMVLVPLLVTSVLFISSSMTSTKEMVYEINNQVVGGMKNSIDMLLNDTVSVIDTVANSEEVISMSPSKMNSILKETVNHYPTISQIYVMNLSGMQIYKTSGELGDRADRGYFQEAKAGNSFFSEVIISRSTNKPIVVFAEPVKKNGKIIAVIGASVDLDYLSTISEQTKPGETGYSYIVDNTGKVIGHKDAEIVANMEDYSGIAPVKNALALKSGRVEYTFESVEYLSEYTFIESTGWGLIVQLPTKEAFATVNRQFYLFLLVGIATAVIGLIIAIYVSNRITKPLVYLNEQMEAVSKGNLTAQMSGKILDRKDEFGLVAKGFNQMIFELKTLIENMIESSEELTKTSSQLHDIMDQYESAINDVASGTVSLAESSYAESESAKKSMDAIEIVADGTTNIEGNVQVLKDIVTKNADVSIEGSEMMTEMSKSIDDIFNTFKVVDGKMNVLVSSAEKIGSFTDAIISIAEQTNLLALNAAIEAARAGDAGKGFAVVADEIRKLAEESNRSAEQITTITNEIQGDILEASRIYQTSSDGMKSVVEKSDKTKTHIESVVVDSNQATEYVDSIMLIIKAQVDEANRIVNIISELLTSTEQTAAVSEEISASTEEQTASVTEINQMTRNLKEMADDFSVMVNQFTIK